MKKLLRAHVRVLEHFFKQSGETNNNYDDYDDDDNNNNTHNSTNVCSNNQIAGSEHASSDYR
jgi:hypothetical protein